MFGVGLGFINAWFRTKGSIRVALRFVYGVLRVYFELFLFSGMFYRCSRHVLEDLALKTNFKGHVEICLLILKSWLRRISSHGFM